MENQCEKKINVAAWSANYAVRTLTDADVPSILTLCLQNPLYYKFCPPLVTEQSIREDMKALPKGKRLEDKYYVGYFQGERLIAVMDLIDGYPNPKTAFIGFFMTEASVQRRGVGSEIVRELCDFLRERRYAAVRLGWVKGNEQSEGFWHRNGFTETGVSYETNGYTVLVAERQL
ncbi:MAG: GNAT family N-acetyltransferase [Lachnospiraceae bacterium]|nr:GNAT family N-acetyltransferase [Lachnospiraceae bacterium]